MEQYIMGPAKTLAVADSSVALLAADLKPTTGKFAGMQAEIALIQAVGPLYVEGGGGAATTASYPMPAGDSMQIQGYGNLMDLRFIRNTNTTSIVWFPFYR